MGHTRAPEDGMMARQLAHACRWSWRCSLRLTLVVLVIAAATGCAGTPPTAATQHGVFTNSGS